jgi:hypothetical protein
MTAFDEEQKSNILTEDFQMRAQSADSDVLEKWFAAQTDRVCSMLRCSRPDDLLAE